jgi:hypothetical protein
MERTLSKHHRKPTLLGPIFCAGQVGTYLGGSAACFWPGKQVHSSTFLIALQALICGDLVMALTPSAQLLGG